jgi:hypothetical protein
MKKFLDRLGFWYETYSSLIWLIVAAFSLSFLLLAMLIWAESDKRSHRYENLEYYCEKNGISFSQSDVGKLEGFSNYRLREILVWEWEDRCMVPYQVRVYR